MTPAKPDGLLTETHPEAIAVTIRPDRFHALAGTMPVPAHAVPGQSDEVIYWFSTRHLVRYLAGDFALPVCEWCGGEGTRCAWDETALCPPVPEVMNLRGCV